MAQKMVHNVNFKLIKVNPVKSTTIKKLSERVGLTVEQNFYSYSSRLKNIDLFTIGQK